MSIQTLFARTLAESTQSNKFRTDTFFATWFRRHGFALFFLFKKNLSVTNIQFSELLALVKEHARLKDGTHAGQLLFYSTEEFEKFLEVIVVPLVEGAPASGANFEQIAGLYQSIVEKIVVVNAYHGSCAIFLPPELTLDLVRVCAESGYVHSCGRSIYVRNIEKAKQSDFFDAIESYLQRFGTPGRTIFFAPYSHEDFSKFDQYKKHVKNELLHGLDDVKIHVEKDSMGIYRLPQVLSELRKRFKERLEVPPPGNFREKHKGLHDRTFWLIRDAGVNPEDFTKPGSQKYYICYDQLYFNASPFHIFNENKPGWIAHTTIPHTLLGAMINVTRPWPQLTSTVVVDPFAGTGTTWLEVLKLPNASVKCSDLSPMVRLLVEDNAQFFGLGLSELDNVAVEFKRLSEDPERPRTPDMFLDPTSRRDSYQLAADLVAGLRNDESEKTQVFSFSEDYVSKLATFSLIQRLVFYTALRAELRFKGALERGSRQWVDAFQESAKDLYEEITSFRDWKADAEHVTEDHGPVAVFRGQYSMSCAISARSLALAKELVTHSGDIVIEDARAIACQSCDVVVTDPPYGFNTNDELSGLAALYSEVIQGLVRAVRNEGHLVLCLPEVSYTGRALPFCTSRSLIISQILSAADDAGRTVILKGASLPFPAPLFRPPYYWTSERALRRVILHFQLVDKLGTPNNAPQPTPANEHG